MKENTIITIGRQYGSGGRELSQILAKKLGVNLYDRQLIHLAAAKLGLNDLTDDDLRDLEDKVTPLSLTFMPFYAFGTHSGDFDGNLFVSEAKVTRKLAKDGSCVILGRCADFVLRDFKQHYSFFICADDDYRTQRGKTVYDGKTLKELNAEDKKRAEYYEYYTGEKWGKAENYDLVINTARVPLEKAADLIIEYINTMQS